MIDGVPETLAELAARHDLTLFTKGHPEEQKLKVERSGLGRYFAHTAIVKEKNADAYRTLVVERDMDPARTWMIGNSPRSDINPAIEAGLNAVFIPTPTRGSWRRKTCATPAPAAWLRWPRSVICRPFFEAAVGSRSAPCVP